MSLDIKSSLTYFTQDKNWKKKFVVGYLLSAFLCICSSVLSVGNNSTISNTQVMAYLLALIPTFYLQGFIFKTANLRIFKPEQGIALWSDYRDIFTVGIKAFFGIFFLSLIVMIPLFITIPVIVASIVAKSPLMPIAALLSIATFLFAVAVISAAYIAFCVDLQFKTMFNFKAMWKIVKKSSKEYLLFMLWVTLLSIAFFVATFILAITIVGILLIPLVWFYFYMIISDIMAQIVKDTFPVENYPIQQ